MDKIITYAQNKEDLLIAGFFPDVTRGFYVDVGAHEPIKHSVTKYFYLKGWNGINIEPQKRIYKLLCEDRPRDINLNIGVSNKLEELEFREYPGGGLSTFSEKMKSEYNADKSMATISHEDYIVKVLPLKEILAKNAKNEHIHFCKIDVEGLEYEVLEGNDWKKFRPELLCIEANHIVKDWHKILEKADYELIMFDGLNEYYLAKESLHRKELFNYPKQFLSSKQVITNELDNLIKSMEGSVTDKEKSIQDTTKELQSAKSQLEKNKAELRSLSLTNKTLYNARYRPLHHVKWLPISVYVTLKKLILRRN
jgi:FkbM family methyltransferase